MYYLIEETEKLVVTEAGTVYAETIETDVWGNEAGGVKRFAVIAKTNKAEAKKIAKECGWVVATLK